MDRGLIQKDMARLIRVSKDTVTNWEKNRSSPNLRALPSVLQFLGSDPRKADESIGGQLVQARQAHGLSQRKLAQFLRVDASTLSKWGLGTGEPQGLYLERVRRLLDYLYAISQILLDPIFCGVNLHENLMISL